MIPTEKNVGGYDRILRGVFAVVCLVAALGVFVLSPFGGTVDLAVVATALLASAGLTFNVVTQRCMGNKVLGINTCSIETED